MSAFSDTFNMAKLRRDDSPSTYIVQDRQNQEELLRLAIQDRLFTAGMGGVLAEQVNPARFENVLDIGSGTGGWVIETAQTYPTMSLVGIDISQRMIDYANIQLDDQDIRERVTFLSMDALALPDLHDKTFDLANLRFGTSYLRIWDWPQVLREMVRVTRPGGIIRLTEVGVIQIGKSAALQKLCEMFLLALHRSNHLFEHNPAGIIPHLHTFLRQQNCQQIQVQPHVIEYRAGTATGEAFYHDAMYIFRTTRPFIQKWGAISKDYDELYQQMLIDIQQPGFQATVNFSTVWGHTPTS